MRIHSHLHKGKPVRITKTNDIELITVYEVSKILNSSLDLHKTLHSVLNVLSSHLQMQRGMVALLQDDGYLQVIAASGLNREEIAHGRFKSGEGVMGNILKSGVPAVVPDIAKEALFLNRTGARKGKNKNVIAFIGVPIKAGRETLGVLSFDRENPDGDNSFGGDVRFLSMVANLIGQTVRLHQKVAEDRANLMHEKQRLQSELHDKYSIDNVIGQSKIMRGVFAEVHQVAPSKSTVLLRGESGTGKEAIARAIHHLSPRKDKPFVKVNCAALSETLLESELFGHEKGSFTGAAQERKGRFEMAHGGTLFLDEIGDISSAFQTKLLRVLQEREFERVGGTKTIKVDVRLVAATNKNLEEAVAKNEFRADLYYRINVVSIFLPPVRERREDIPLLAEFFLQQANQENGKHLKFSAEAMHAMCNCQWPGNVRELGNCVERIAAMTQGNIVRKKDMLCDSDRCFSSIMWQQQSKHAVYPIASAPAQAAFTRDAQPPAAETSLPPPAIVYGDPQKQQIVEALEKCGWVQAKAARLLGITPRQMGYAIIKYDIDVKRY
ncbi:MAG: nif-specific transcriptional activator NifA [Nitrosomonadales bacterium]|nr:nif-specific transcriptional activator NifA [Nitrosomonadales bacterium]